MGTVVALAPGVHDVHVHEGGAVASLHHLVADLLQQHQGQQASHHQGLEKEDRIESGLTDFKISSWKLLVS